MKLKFDEEVQVVIDAIAALPSAITGAEALKKPYDIIREFDKKLIEMNKLKGMPAKQWARLRRQLSFMYEFVRLSTTKGVMDRFAMEEHALAVQVNPETPKPEFEPNTDKITDEVAYYALVKMFKDIKSGELLKSAPFIRVAMRYGVFYLSDQEIQGLIDNNKV